MAWKPNCIKACWNCIQSDVHSMCSKRKIAYVIKLYATNNETILRFIVFFYFLDVDMYMYIT